jgi:hypothetical protein
LSHVNSSLAYQAAVLMPIKAETAAALKIIVSGGGG